MRSSVVTQALCVAFALALFWLFRFELVAVGGNSDRVGYAYKLDRWTGNVTYLVTEHAVRVNP